MLKKVVTILMLWRRFQAHMIPKVIIKTLRTAPEDTKILLSLTKSCNTFCSCGIACVSQSFFGRPWIALFKSMFLANVEIGADKKTINLYTKPFLHIMMHAEGPGCISFQWWGVWSDGAHMNGFTVQSLYSFIRLMPRPGRWALSLWTVWRSVLVWRYS